MADPRSRKICFFNHVTLSEVSESSVPLQPRSAVIILENQYHLIRGGSQAMSYDVLSQKVLCWTISSPSRERKFLICNGT
jgi:hypothetical protein